jgi:hypothetical protein
MCARLGPVNVQPSCSVVIVELQHLGRMLQFTLAAAT